MMLCKNIGFSVFDEITMCLRLASSLRRKHDLLPSFIEKSTKCNETNHVPSGIKVWPDFVTEAEEMTLMKEIDRKWRRLKYQQNHWDNAIQNYRELELSRWSSVSASILETVRGSAFKNDDRLKNLTHVLDLHEDGVITAHVDSTRFCGRALAGLCLLSPCVMKFTKVAEPDVWYKVLLSRRCLYLMEDDARYDYSHQILHNKESYFNGQFIHKSRRVSVITRTEPDENNCNNDPARIFKSTVVSLD